MGRTKNTHEYSILIYSWELNLILIMGIENYNITILMNIQ